MENNFTIKAGPYAVLKEFDVEAHHLQEVTDLLKELQINVLGEQGCYAFEILQSEENQEKLYLYECFENMTAHAKHTESPYFRELVSGKLNPLLRDKKIIRVKPV